MRTGDVVKHKPTGETWVVAYVDHETGYMAYCGWPEGEAKIADCEVTKPVDDYDHERWLGLIARSTGKRARRAREQLEALNGGR